MNKKIKHKTVIKYFSRLLFFSLLLLCSGESFSQAIYPVQATTQVIPPYTPDVPRYYTGTQEKLRVTLTNLDMQEPTLNVYLRMKITSSSFSIITPPEVYTPAIQLQAGVPLQLSLNDLEPYFKKENMRISGGQSKFYQTMQLPDNFYRFQFEVYEVRTNRLLSNPRIGFAQMMIAAGAPPFLNLPRTGSKIEESNIPNILFTWTPRHMNSVASAYGTEYEFTLVEIYDKRVAPENAFQYSRVLYSERTRSTAFTHTAAHPMLIPGMRYAWCVQAIAKEGIEDANVFKNNGYSQIYWFDYIMNCPAVKEFGAVLENMKANITWVNTQATDYTVEYRKKGSNKWYTGNIGNNSLCTVYNLKYGETYEYRIGSRCVINDDYQYSSVKAFTMPERPEKSPNCGLMPNVNLTDRTPIRELISGVPVFAGDFPVTITKVSNLGGRFSGEGYVGIPYMKLPRVAVTFKNILVNSQYQLIDGYFETKFDLEKNMIWDVDKTLTGGKGVGDIRSGEEIADFKVDYTINPDIQVKPLNDDRTEDEIKAGKDYTIQKNENGKYQFIITDSEGNEHQVESDKIPVTIQDKSGNTYEINEEGEVTTISQSSDIILNDETKDKIRTNIAEVTFEETSNTKYALDVYREVYADVTEYFQTYKPSDRESAASAKFMVPGQSDEIFVKLTKVILKGFDPNKVHFITSKGKKYTSIYDNNKQGWVVTLLGSDANDGQELYVVYDEAINKPSTLARLNLYSYTPTTITVKLVPVNGFDNGFTKSTVEKELNAIYNKVGITCRVEMLSSFDYEPLKGKDFKVDGSGFFSTQTNDMKQLNAAYLAEHPNEKDICLFIIQNVDGNEGIAGDMPRGKQFGYLFSKSTTYTIAHEIGHGLFHLDHPFARANGSKSFPKDSLRDNLMQYHDGTHLAKLQWDMIHAPGLVIGIFEKDGDGQSHKVKDIKAFLDWVKSNLGKKDIAYDKEQFYDGKVISDYPIAVDSLNLRLYIEFEDSGSINLEKNNNGGFPGVGVEFQLNKTFHNGFYFKIKYANSSKEAIKIWFYSYEEFTTFLSYLGVKLTDTVKDSLITAYKSSIDRAGDDCDKLDVIYESIPDFVISEISDETLIANLKALSSCQMSNSTMKILIGWGFDTDEEKAALNILKNIEDKELLYSELYKSPKTVIDLYKKIDSDNSKILTQLLTNISTEYWKDKENLLTKTYNEFNQYTNDYPNIFYILPNHTVNGKLDNDRIKLHGNYFHGPPVQVTHIPQESSFHPLDPVFVVFTQGGNVNEQKSLCIPAVSLLYMADQQYWDDAQKGAMGALQLLGVYASAYTYVSSTSKLIRTIAALEVANEATRLFMNNENVRLYFESQPWGADFLTGYTVISTGVDILSISTGVITALSSHADDVRHVLRSNNISADDLAEYERVIGKVIDKIPNKLIDDEMLEVLLKDIKYLPGPQLPEKIAETFDLGVYINRKLLVDEKLFKYHGINNRTGRKYSWFTNRKYVSEKELRENLAIRADWGVQIEFVTEFRIPKGTWLSEGKAAAQGNGYPGGGYQAVVTNTPKAWIIKTDKAFK